MATRRKTVNRRQTPRRILACTCSHGTHINRAAADELMRFKREFSPHITIHLGDFLDTTAFMRSAGPDERGQSVIDDCTAGIDFLRELQPNVVFVGNHDYRLYKETRCSDKRVEAAAQYVIERLEACVALLGADLVPYTGVLDGIGWRRIGRVVFGHGVMYGEQAARDHAEAFGRSCVFGHTHKLLRQPGRTMTASTGYSIGCLCDKPAMRYAAGRRATMAWDNGWLYGEIMEDEEWLHLHSARAGKATEIPAINLRKA